MTRRYRRKRYYSTAERILVHLSASDPASRPAPEARTQDGIATAILSGRSTATKWLAQMERREWVVRERARVPGHPLPKYAYRLTEAGWLRTRRIRQRLAEEVVEVRSPSLGALTVHVADVPGLTTPRLDLTTATCLVREGRIDLTRVPATRPSGPLVWGSGLRHVDRLFGRDWELRALDAWYASPSRVLLLTGLPGIGKSAVVAGWIQRRGPASHVFGFELRSTTRATGFLGDLASFLATLGKPHLRTLLEQGGKPDMALLERLLARDLAKLPILIVVDNADQASGDVARFLNETLLGLAHVAPVKMALVCRRTPSWLGPHSATQPMEILRLHGLHPKASADLLRHRGFLGSEAAAWQVIESTKGHPFLLHLAAQGRGAKASTIEAYLEGELWTTLPVEARTVLETVCVFRRPMPLHVLESTAAVRPGVIEELLARNLLERTVAEGYFAHDLLRDFVQRRMNVRRRRELNERVAKALLKEPGARERWEGVVHLLAADRAAEAAAYLDSEGAPLMDSIAAEEVASLARGLRLQAMDPTVSCVFAEIVGDSMRTLGHIGPALFQYEHARRTAEAHGKAERIPRLLRKMAFLERCRNHYPRAFGYLVEAQARLSMLRNPPEMTEVLREMALVEQASGDLDEAAKHLDEAIDLATDTGDLGALSRALLALGSLEIQRGYAERGLEYDLEGLRVAERSGNLTEVAHAHIVVGTALTGTGKAAESLTHYEKGLRLAQLLGNLRLTAYATMNRTNALLDLGEYKDAGGSLREAEGYFEILEERDTLAFLKTYEGEWEMGLGHWARARRAWEEGLAGLREHGSPADLALILKEIGGFYAAHGDEEESRVHLLEARSIAEKLGNAPLLLEIERALGHVEGSHGRQNAS